MIFRISVSAQFRRLRIFNGAHDRVICGEINVKNGYSGYAGFEPFAVALHPNGKASTYNPYAFAPEMRESLRRAAREAGCSTASMGQTLEQSPLPSQQGPDNLIKRWMKENEACRGGAGDEIATMRACARREVVSKLLTAANWCYGREREAGYQHDWHRCELTSIRAR